MRPSWRQPCSGTRLTKKEEPDDLIKKDEADSVLVSQTEPDPRGVLTAAPDEEILIPQCPMCVCDHSLALCFQCQSFQLTVLATSDRFLLAEVTSELQNKNGVTKESHLLQNYTLNRKSFHTKRFRILSFQKI